MRVLLDNEFVRLEELEDRHVLVLRRKAQAPPAAEIPTVYREAIEHTSAARAVVLVRSMAGRLQIERTSRDDGTRVLATSDEAEALRLAQNDGQDSFW